MSTFCFGKNRSERALQVELLVPVLFNKTTRWEVLSKIVDDMSREESDAACVMHFVWVLRDSFYYAREKAKKDKSWKKLITEWVKILDLPEWALDVDWWRHPDGEYKGDKNYVVHPCANRNGWTEKSIEKRVRELPIYPVPSNYMTVLIRARQVMNTECDCFIQTPERLIVIECKDKTSFRTEQIKRQKELLPCLKRLFDLKKEVEYVEVSREDRSAKTENWLPWDMISEFVKTEFL